MVTDEDKLSEADAGSGDDDLFVVEHEAATAMAALWSGLATHRKTQGPVSAVILCGANTSPGDSSSTRTSGPACVQFVRWSVRVVPDLPQGC